MTVKEILELTEEQQREYILQHRVNKPHNIYELVNYIKEVEKFTTVMGAVEKTERLIGWYQGQAKAYAEVLEILVELGLKVNNKAKTLVKSQNSIDSVIQAVESGLDDIFGVDRHTFKQKVITATRVTYRLTNGGWVTIKMKNSKIWKVKVKGCDEEVVKNLIENVKKSLTK